jgi:2-iminobutanoate/2-iminopropanoate deaminase
MITTRLARTALVVPLLASGCASRTDVRHLPAQGALGPYSASVEAHGLLFVSGKIGARGGDFAAEAASAIDAVEAELARAGLALRDVVSATVYLTDIGRYAELNQAWERRFAEPFPARACIAVAALPGGARVEVAVVAARR